MGELIYLEDYRTFRDAQARARFLALQYKKQTGVCRNEAGWDVLVDSGVAAQVRKTPTNAQGSNTAGESWNCFADDYLVEDPAAEQEYEREVLEPLFEEMAEDQEDWARSNEEGWFYGDEGSAADNAGY